jgi:hypothetical protein
LNRSHLEAIIKAASVWRASFIATGIKKKRPQRRGFSALRPF